MKLFNKTDGTQTKIISTDDIAIVKNNQIIDDNLTDVIDNQQNDINDLKSNVKWLYKYGGVGGTGGDGSNSGSSKYGVIVMIDDNVMTEGIILDKNKVNHKLTIRISNHKQKNYRFRYKLTSESAFGSSYRTFPTANNDWEFNTNVVLTKNSKLSVEVRNEDDIITLVEYNYILDPFTLNANIYDNNNNKIQEENILIKTYKQYGFKYVINYNIAIDAKVSYKITCNNSILQNIIDNQLIIDENGKYIINEKQGQISINLNDLLQNENAGQYFITTTIYIDQTGQPVKEFPFANTFYLIPEDLYLVISSEKNNILYDNQQSDYLNDDSNVDFFQSGMNTIIIKPYNNNSTKDQIFISGTYTYKDENNEWGEEHEIINNEVVIVRNPKRIIINFHAYADKTEYKLKFTAKLGQNTETKEFIKYVYIKKSNEDYTWYGLYKEGNNFSPIKPGLGIYYKEQMVDKYGDININNVDLKKYNYKPYINIYANNKHNISLLSDLSFGAAQTVVLNIGIQLNYVNNENVDILKINYNNNESLLVSQSYVKKIENDQTSDTNITSIYIPKEKEYNPNNNKKYHLLTIVSRAINPDNANDQRSELVCYIDGIIEGAFHGSVNRQSFLTYINSIELLPANYSINLFELSYFNLIFSDIYVSNYYNTYNKLYNNDDSIRDDKEIIDILMRDGLTRTNNDLLQIDNSVVATLAKNSDIPILILSYNKNVLNKDNKSYDFFDNWFLNIFKEDDTSENVNWSPSVTATWLRHEELTGNKQISITDDNNNINPANFRIKLQGTSTKAFSIKNLSLSIDTPNNDENHIYVFSPNFGDNNIPVKDQFLPEMTFTLKADVSDSSHRNNTTIGSFVNDNTEQFADATANIKYSNYKPYIKNCLLGFPIILIFEEQTVRTDGSIESSKYYYMGLYNFNLGRDSHFNLGYVGIKENSELFSNNNLISPEYQQIKIYEININDYQLLDTLCVAEIQGNRPEFDFSQFDQSILFKQNDLDSQYMYGDIKANDINNAMISIREFTKGVAYLGGYMFKFIGKNFSDNLDEKYGYKYGYSAHVDGNTKESINQVPNFQYQCVKDNEFNLIFNSNQKISDIGNKNISESDFAWDSGISSKIMNFYIGESNIEDETRYSPGIDITSLVEYYTVCMAFGMTDSVQKNLNIKTWTANLDHSFEGTGDKDKYYIAFYDMDTALGRSNKGYNTKYFAFSDYYNINPVYNSSNTAIISENIIRYMDFWPNANENNNDSIDSDGFDIPSTYLFAIAKYQSIFANLSGFDNDITTAKLINNNPLNIWAKFRYENGPLRNSKYFIDNYFNKNFNNIPNVLISLNYRLKYLRLNNDNTTNDNTTLFISHDIEPLHGTCTYFVEDWLAGRLHILDMYFNLNSKQKLIYKYDKLRNEWNIVTYNNNNLKDNWNITSVQNINNNADIYILQSMFSNSTNQNVVYPGQKEIAAYVYAPYLTTSIIEGTVTGSRTYLFIDDISIPIYVNFITGGEENILFMGSVAWTDVSDLSSFLDRNFNLIINSDYLQRIVLTNDNVGCSRLTLSKVNSVKEIIINGQKHNFELKLENLNLYNLDNIDLHNSKIQISIITNLNISKLNLSNVINNNDINITGCKNLTDINLDGLTCKSLVINPIIVNNLRLNNVTCKSINLTYDDTNTNESSIEIMNCSELTTLSLKNFTNITIHNCPKLYNLEIIDGNNNKLKNLSITKCNTYSDTTDTENYKNSWYLTLNNVELNDTHTFDLSKFSELESIAFSNSNGTNTNNNATLKFNKVILPNNIDSQTGLPRNIDLKPGAFAYTDLEKITKKDSNNEETYNVNLTINGPKTFKNTSYSTYYDDPNNRNHFIINTDDLSEMFAIDNNKTPKLTVTKYNYIIEEITNADRITNMFKMFYGQKDIAPDNSNNILQSLAKFVNVNNIKQIFDGTGITYIYKELFNDNNTNTYIGKNTTSFIMEQFVSGNKNIYIQKDAFKNILPKLTSLIFNEGTIITVFDINIDNNNNFESVQEAASLFNINEKLYIKTITNLNFSSASNDVENLFTYLCNNNNPNETINISNCFIMHNIEYVNINNTGLKDVQNKLTITNSFNNDLTPIYIYNFFNWDKINNESDFITDNKNTSSLECPKIINDFTYKDENDNNINEWNIIWNKLARFNSLKNIFKNCIIKSKTTNGGHINEDSSNNNELYYELCIPDYNYNIQTTNSLFYKLKVYNITNNVDDTTNVPIKLTENTFTHLDTIKKYYYMFAFCTLYDNLPLNLFGRVKSRNSITINKIKDKNEEEISLGTDITFGNIYVYNETVNKNITDLSYMFYNTVVKNKTYFDVSNINNINNIQQIINEQINNFDKYGEITFYYNDEQITGLEYLSDMFNLNGDYSNIVYTDNSNNEYKNILLGKQNCINNLFVAPDLLYACDTNCKLEYMFYNDMANNDGVETNKFEGIIPRHFFSKLHYTNDSDNIYLSNMLKNVTIIPNKCGEYKFACPSYYMSDNTVKVEYIVKTNNIYTFIPENFVNQTTNNNQTNNKVTNFTNFFNFNLIVPENESDIKEYYNTYYIMFANSLLNNQLNEDIRIKINCMPDSANTNYSNASYIYKDISGNSFNRIILANDLTAKHRIHFNIMFDKAKLDEIYSVNDKDIYINDNVLNTDKLFEYEGIQTQYFGEKFAMLSYIINPTIAQNLYGYILSPANYIDENYTQYYAQNLNNKLMNICKKQPSSYLSCYALFNCSDTSKQYYRSYIQFNLCDNTRRSPINIWQGLTKYSSTIDLLHYNSDAWNDNMQSDAENTNIGIKTITYLREEESNISHANSAYREIYKYQYSLETIMNIPFNDKIMTINDDNLDANKYNLKLVD